MLALTFRSMLPPPTERTRTASRACNRPTSNHDANTECQPSSLIRAVNSEMLSVGEYASIPVSLRKSLTACEALAALPPTPMMNRRPARWRTVTRRAAVFSMASMSSRFATSATSARNEAENAVDVLDIGRDSNPSRSPGKNRSCHAIPEKSRFHKNARALRKLRDPGREADLDRRQPDRNSCLEESPQKRFCQMLRDRSRYGACRLSDFACHSPGLAFRRTPRCWYRIGPHCYRQSSGREHHCGGTP